MEKTEVARILDQIASFLELKGENTFRVRAYQTASRAVSGFQGDITEALQSGQLAEVKGIGPATLEIIHETVTTGRSRVLDDLRAQIPSGLVDMMRISGLGVAKVRQIHESLGIETLDELEAAAHDGRLATLPRFGDKTAQKILRGLRFVRQASESRLFHHARGEARTLGTALAEVGGVARAEIAGSVRRRCEVVQDLDFVVALDGSRDELTQRLDALGGVTEFLGETGRTVTLKLASGAAAEIHLSSTDQIGFHLVMATGNAAHVDALAGRAEALGLQWTEKGIERDGVLLPCPEESVVYDALDLPYIAPELREGLGEIEAAAAGTLPRLVGPEDMRGFLHCHSNYSDGKSTIREWAIAARDHGYEYVGITDHSAAAAYAGGLHEDAIREQHAEIDRVNREIGEITVLKGVEVDILRDGTLDYDAAVRASFDFIIASVHTRFGQDGGQMTARLLRAMDDPHMTILGHPTGRLLLSRDPYPMDLEAVFEKAIDRGVAVEINADPQRLDLDWRFAKEAAERGVLISIGADAHSTAAMDYMDLGIGIARKGWLTAHHILNSRGLNGFVEHVAKRRSAN